MANPPKARTKKAEKAASEKYVDNEIAMLRQEMNDWNGQQIPKVHVRINANEKRLAELEDRVEKLARFPLYEIIKSMQIAEAERDAAVATLAAVKEQVTAK